MDIGQNCGGWESRRRFYRALAKFGEGPGKVMAMAAPEPVNTAPENPLDAYDYQLPRHLIAQAPAKRRVQARLMVLARDGQGVEHGRISHLCRLLRPGDLLVLNDTKVVPARVLCSKKTGGRVEVFFLSPARPRESGPGGAEVHEALIQSHRPVRAGTSLALRGGESIRVLTRCPGGVSLVKTKRPALEILYSEGQAPLPPYIKRPCGPSARDQERYQTVYAREPGAVAAPTAGLHLSRELLRALAKRGVGSAAITLHVGYGTFAETGPVELAAGRLHPEWVEVSPQTAAAVTRTRREGGRIIAVGTTCARALEWRGGPGGVLQPGRGWCSLLIVPGRRFMILDGLITNFHLPRTTLLMLVAALAGRERVLAAYAQAVERGYRFYSFGDAMLIV